MKHPREDVLPPFRTPHLRIPMVTEADVRKALRKVTYTLEHNWLQRLGLSHFLVLERL